MTLNTRIWIKEEIDVTDFFWWVNDNLLKAEDPRFIEEKTEDSHSLRNRIAQGFSAIFEVEAFNSPQKYVDEYYEDGDAERELIDFDDSIKSYHAKQEAIGEFHADLSFDTGYGYQKDGMTCNDLHAYFITRIYRDYLEPKGNSLVWQNEYSGEVFENLDGFEGFSETGKSAIDWFEGLRQIIEGGHR